jgi:hypothetical protein
VRLRRRAACPGEDDAAWIGFMDRRIAELNIEHLQKKLAEESDPSVRETMQRLLEEERAKLMKLRSLSETKKSD